MKTFCGITEWEKSVGTRGRGKGKTFTTRYVLAADKWNWIIGYEKEGAQIIGQKYGLKFTNLLLAAESIRNGLGLEAAQRIAAHLEEITGKHLEIDPDKDLKTIGAEIDETYDVNLFKNRNHMKRFFGTAENADDEIDNEGDEE